MNRAEALERLEHDSRVLEAKIRGLRELVFALAGDVEQEYSGSGDALQRARHMVKAIAERQQMLAPEIQRMNDLITQVTAHQAQVEALSSDGEPTYANLRWTADDVLTAAANQGLVITKDEAHSLLAEHETVIQEVACSRGWDAMDDIIHNWAAKHRPPRK